MSVILHPLEIPLLSYDQSHDDTYNKMFSTLSLLQENINQVFGRIKERMSVEKGLFKHNLELVYDVIERLDEVNNRVSVCKSQVEAIRGTRKRIFENDNFLAHCTKIGLTRAVTIYSTPKYPVEANKVGPFHSLYYNQFESEISEIQPEKEEHKVLFF